MGSSGGSLLFLAPPACLGQLYHVRILELLMATSAERGHDSRENAGIAPENAPAASAPTPAAAAVHHRQLNDGWHPWQTLIGLMGYGRRGTLRNKHIFTLCFKLVLGIAQVNPLMVWPHRLYG